MSFEKKNQLLKIQKSKLEGSVKLSGAKNSALKLIIASLLTNDEIILYNFPIGLLDIQIELKMLEKLGKEVTIINSSQVSIKDGTKGIISNLDWEDRSVRGSLLILGALFARIGEGRVPLPGGCNLGDRKYDIHLDIIRSFGGEIWEENGYLCAKRSKVVRDIEINLPIRSTGATENAILIGVITGRRTIINGPHIRPEIIDLIALLKKMGAKIDVYGQKSIEIHAVEALSGASHTTIPDNMEALTWAIGAAITGGEVEIIDFPKEHLVVPMIFLKESGLKYWESDNSIIVKGSEAYPVEICTGPYPGINSDMQPLFAIYGAYASGLSKINDLRFPGRFGYAHELSKMGLDFYIEHDILHIKGGQKLTGAQVKAIDLRAGIALVLAGLISEGETIIEDPWMIERGYENLYQKLNDLAKR